MVWKVSSGRNMIRIAWECVGFERNGLCTPYMDVFIPQAGLVKPRTYITNPVSGHAHCSFMLKWVKGRR